jgi:hypothetical protein
MDLLKKLVIVFAVGALLHIQFPLTGFADAKQVDTKQTKVTKNKPQFSGSDEEFLPGAGSATSKLSKKSTIWIAAGAAVLALALVASSGGGGGGGNEPANNDPGGVEVEW